MTQERLEELRNRTNFTTQSDAQDFYWLIELLDEIDRLNKVINQAITLSEMDISDINGRIWCDERSLEATSCPELTDELKKRGKMSKWEETGIDLDTFGPLTRMDIEIMDSYELQERKRLVTKWISEFEEELCLIEEFEK